MDPRPLPRYQCHKEVSALKIKAVLNPNEGLLRDDGERVLTFCEPGYEACAFVVDAEYVRKHDPQPGGYYVVYDDGYRSFSPAAPFEQGYCRIEETPKAEERENLSWAEVLQHLHAGLKVARTGWADRWVEFGPHAPHFSLGTREPQSGKAVSVRGLIHPQDLQARDWKVIE